MPSPDPRKPNTFFSYFPKSVIPRENIHPGERRRRRECRLNAAFVACFQSSHICGNLASRDGSQFALSTNTNK